MHCCRLQIAVIPLAAALAPDLFVLHALHAKYPQVRCIDGFSLMICHVAGCLVHVYEAWQQCPEYICMPQLAWYWRARKLYDGVKIQ